MRLRVSSHVTTAIVERLPVPTRHHRPAAFREIAALARLLARRHDEHAFVRLQLLAADLYQLTVAEFGHVVGTFPLFPEETRRRVLTGYRETPR